MSNLKKGASSSLFDSTSGKWVGVYDIWGNEQLVSSVLQNLTDLGGSQAGFVGQFSASNIGVNWESGPFNPAVTVGSGLLHYADNSLAYPGANVPGSPVRLFFNLDSDGGPNEGLFVDGTTTINPSRLSDLVTLLRLWHGQGQPVKVIFNGPVSADPAVLTRFRDRLQILLTQPVFYDGETGQIDAAGCLNETVYRFNATPGANPAEVYRIFFKQFQAYSPEDQGGVAVGSDGMGSGSWTESWFGRSAQSSVVVQNDGGGAGTTGEMFFHVLGFHPYVTASTLIDVQKNFTGSPSARELFSYINPLRAIVARRRLANPAYWGGRPDPEIWATEFNFNAGIVAVLANTDFRMQVFTRRQRGQLILALCIAALGAGCSKLFLYAADDAQRPGPFSVSTFGSNALGELRISGLAPGPNGTPIFDGDLLKLQYGSLVGGEISAYAYNAALDGSAFDVKGLPAAQHPSQMSAFRWVLGGWASELPWVISQLSGQLETGFYLTGNSADPLVPQLRINRGAVRRQVDGVLTSVA